MLLSTVTLGISLTALKFGRPKRFLPLFLSAVAGAVMMIDFGAPTSPSWTFGERAWFSAATFLVFGGLNAAGTMLDPEQCGPGAGMCLILFSPILGGLVPAVAQVAAATPGDAALWARFVGTAGLALSLALGRSMASD